jgi:hypothetical protein
MEYYILGRHKNKLVVDHYVAMVIKALKLHRLTKRSIIIDFKTSLDDEALGLCFGVKDVAQVSIARKSNGVSQTFLEQMQTLAHELVHVKQYMRGELGYNQHGDFKWKKRNAGGYKYENQPWEKEAERLEKILFIECFPFDMEIS